MSNSFLTVAVAFVVVFAAGCGASPPELVEVEGTVTLNGQPLEKVRVEFWPLNDGPQSAALTDDQGRFALSTWDATKKGAIPGRHKVVLRDESIYTVPFRGRANEDVDMTGGQKPRIAENYTNVTKTPLEVEITGEKRDLVFEVQPYAGSGESGVTKSR